MPSEWNDWLGTKLYYGVQVMGNVVHLNFKSANTEEEHVSFTCCANCKNKTFTVTNDAIGFPLMKCAACGAHIGLIGFANEPQQD